MHIVCMQVRWDPNKAAENYRKHGVRFSDAELVLFDPRAITVENGLAEGEQRWVSIGMDVEGRLRVVVYTYRGEEARLISARKATQRERRRYESGV